MRATRAEFAFTERGKTVNLTIELGCDNAAFDDDPTAEVARILRALADRMEGASPDEDYPLRDANGQRARMVFGDRAQDSAVTVPAGCRIGNWSPTLTT